MKNPSANRGKEVVDVQMPVLLDALLDEAANDTNTSGALSLGD